MLRIPGALRLVEASLVLQLMQVMALGDPEPRLLFSSQVPYTYAPTIPQVIRSYGYPVEIHHVITADGYVLEMHRIPYGIAGSDDPTIKRPAAFLHHGLFSSSADFTVNSPQNALAYRLADSGYDVWMANCRGNQYSQAHLYLDTRSADYWEFSWDQIAEFDVPAEINYILDTTGQDQLNYVGYSMGSSVFFAGMNEHPELMSKIKVMVGVAPGGYVGHAGGVARVLAPWRDVIHNVLELLGIHNVLPGGDSMDVFLNRFCGRPYSPQMANCIRLLSSFVGPEYWEMDQMILPLALVVFPAGASVHTLLHFGQIIQSGGFHKFDYGSAERNMARYGQSTPPHYHPCKVTVPVALFYGDSDYLTPKEDVERLRDEIPNLIFSKEISQPHYNHLDFIWGLSADELVYTEIIRIFDEYNN